MLGVRRGHGYASVAMAPGTGMSLRGAQRRSNLDPWMGRGFALAAIPYPNANHPEAFGLEAATRIFSSASGGRKAQEEPFPNASSRTSRAWILFCHPAQAGVQESRGPNGFPLAREWHTGQQPRQIVKQTQGKARPALRASSRALSSLQWTPCRNNPPMTGKPGTLADLV